MSKRISVPGTLSKKRPFKIVIIGDAAVGKTSLIQKLMYDSFSTNYSPTVEDLYECNHSKSYTLQIMDTSGYYHFPAMRELSIRSSSACILVFDISREDTLQSLVSIYETVSKTKGEKFYPVILVGNKIDLKGVGSLCLSEKASHLSTNFFKCTYFETSARDHGSIEIQKIFNYLVNLCLAEEYRLKTQELIWCDSHSTRRSSSVAITRCFSKKIQLINSLFYHSNDKTRPQSSDLTTKINETKKNCSIS